MKVNIPSYSIQYMKMWKEIIYTFGLIFFYEVCGGPVQQLIPKQESLTAQIIRPQITSVPVDSSVSNSLANALQLLIVSDVIAKTINPRATVPSCMLPTVTTICDQIPSPVIYSSAVDLIAPRTEFISPCASPIVEFLRPQSSSMESIINVSPVTSLGSNIYSLQEIVSAFPNFAPTNGPRCLQELVGPVQIASLGANSPGSLAELLGPLRGLGPVTELIYPPGMQGALTFNVGSPSPIPYGNLNVETIPYSSVNYFY